MKTMMRWMGEASSVTANSRIFCANRYNTKSNQWQSITIPDHLVVLADMECGALATFILSTITGGKSAYEISLYGSDGSLRFADGILYSATPKNKHFSEVYCRPEDLGGWRVEEEFISAIRGFEPITHTTFETGLKYMCFTEAVSRSLLEAKTISLLN